MRFVGKKPTFLLFNARGYDFNFLLYCVNLLFSCLLKEQLFICHDDPNSSLFCIMDIYIMDPFVHDSHMKSAQEVACDHYFEERLEQCS